MAHSPRIGVERRVSGERGVAQEREPAEGRVITGWVGDADAGRVTSGCGVRGAES
jgi:hypothetical protein